MVRVIGDEDGASGFLLKIEVRIFLKLLFARLNAIDVFPRLRGVEGQRIWPYSHNLAIAIVGIFDFEGHIPCPHTPIVGNR